MFYKASNLSQVSLPHGIKKIGSYAFADTPKLTSISLPNTLEEIDNFAFEKAGLTSITLPSTITEIGSNAFCKTKITSVILPNSLTYIAPDAFAECPDLQTATINCNCNMGRYIFSGSNKLTNVNISSNCLNKVFSSGALGSCPNLAKINNIQILRKSTDGKPYFDSRYSSIITQNFAINDDCRVSFINDYLNAMLKYVVKNETAGCTTDAQKIRKLHDWVCNKVDYAFVNGKPDSSLECHVDSSVFFRNTTVCDGYARALTLLLREAGLEAYALKSSSHAWTMVKLGNRYFHLDACHDDVNPIDYGHYLKSDNDIKKCTVGHSSWYINKPSFRFTYTIPSKTPVCSYSVGDINKDGKVDAKDSSALTSIIVGNLNNYEKLLADANGDGVIDISDASFLRKLYS